MEAEGYTPDNPLKLKTATTVILGSPELTDVTEATAVMWADLGVELEFERLDFATFVNRLRLLTT